MHEQMKEQMKQEGLHQDIGTQKPSPASRRGLY